VALDLRREPDREALLGLLAKADVLVEGFRPGVMSRLGLDPAELTSRFPRLVLCSLSGWGQSGPWAALPGHDINFVGLAGLLALGARPEGKPLLPGIQAADLNGGSISAAFAITAALLARERTGRGAHLDIAMADGALTLAAPALATLAALGRSPAPGGDLLTGGTPSYGIYRCADGRFLTFAPLEPRFWRLFVDRSGYQGDMPDEIRIAALLATRTRDAWAEILLDACVAPLLELDEVPHAPHFVARDVLRIASGRLSLRPPAGCHVEGHAPTLGQHDAELLGPLWKRDP
jgi:crotonobetainyl-CoA:carnitine CoA-transferase CaiB-like acyl-CoA transferase